MAKATSSAASTPIVSSANVVARPRVTTPVQQVDKTAAQPQGHVVSVAVTEPDGETDEETDEQQQGFVWSRTYSSWAVSMLVHMLLLVILGLWVVHDVVVRNELFVVVSDTLDELDEEEIETPEFESKEIEDLQPEPDAIVNSVSLEADSIVSDESLSGAELAALEMPTDITRIPDLLASGELMFELPEVGGGKVPAGATGKGKQQGSGQGEADSGAGRDLGGRAERRRQMLASGELSASQPVVDDGLVWLARHQFGDGSWSFDHRVAVDCKFKCPNPGDLPRARFAATGMALLPFLGAGYTHEEGKYKRQVAAGLLFMMKHMGKGGSLWDSEGRMYGQGIATLALCEAFGTATQATGSLADEDADKVHLIDNQKLGRAAQLAANYINASQGPGGGWRYNPREIGDTSVLGWQIMALKSAKDAGLAFDKRVRRNALVYLSNVDADRVGDEHYGYVGTQFAYMADRKSYTRATSAIGMLCHIYMGVSARHPAAEVVVQRLLQQGHGGGDMYFNYYANQIMYQHGGDEWKQWHNSISPFLIGSQARDGHMKGSWMMPNGDHGAKSGGRLYCTVMALLCLEEHYRHLRIAADAGGNQGPLEGGDKPFGNENAVPPGKAGAPKNAPLPANPAAAAGEAEAKVDAKPPANDFPLD